MNDWVSECETDWMNDILLIDSKYALFGWLCLNEFVCIDKKKKSENETFDSKI